MPEPAKSYSKGPINLGPILGSVSNDEARIWIKTRWPVTFHVNCRGPSGMTVTSEETTTDEQHDLTGVAVVTGLKPNTNYSYDIVADSASYASHDFAFRTSPVTTEGFCFAFGSCYRPLVANNGVFEQLYLACCDGDPDRLSFLLMIGDQIYADQSGVHGVEWKAATFDEFCEIYQKSWSADPYFMKVLSRCPTYMIFDDHEVENAWFKIRQRIGDLRGVSGNKRLKNAIDAYECYQNSHNPSPISEDLPYSYEFSWGDVRFFVIDARYQRETRFWHQAFPYHRDILGERQWEELRSWLERYRDDLKFVVTSVPISHIALQFPFLGPLPGLSRFAQVDQWPGFAWGRRRLIKFIREHEIGRLIFLAGDVHISHYLEFLPTGRGKKFYQFTCSPFANDTRMARIQRWFLADHIWGYRKNLTSLNFFEEPCYGRVNIERSGGQYRVRFSVVDGLGGLFPMNSELTL